jgi:hypothetical protein
LCLDSIQQRAATSSSPVPLASPACNSTMHYITLNYMLHSTKSGNPTQQHKHSTQLWHSTCTSLTALRRVKQPRAARIASLRQHKHSTKLRGTYCDTAVAV